MAISLQKGGRISLTKEAPTLNQVHVGLGWDERTTDGAEFDLDASAFLLNEQGKVRSDSDFIFYNQLESSDGSVRHTGDNRTGTGEGDDEVLLLDLSRIPADIKKVAFTVTIHDAEARHQNFGQVTNAFIRLVNAETNEEVVRYDLTEESSIETALIFGEIYRHNDEWRFSAVGQGYAGGLASLCQQYGVNV